MEQNPRPQKHQPAGHWIKESEETLFESRSMSMFVENCRSSEDESKTHRFYVFRSRDWCNVIPVTEDGKVVLVRQHRVGAHLHTLELPGGVVDPDEQLSATALRELAEETGYEPLPGARCIRLGGSHSNPAIFDNQVHAFIVGPVSKTREQKLDPAEMIEVVEVPIEELPTLVASGGISHALMLASFLHLLMTAPGARDGLVGALKEFSGTRK